MYNDSNTGRKPLPFAMAEKVDNGIAATRVTLELLAPRSGLSLEIEACQTTHATFSRKCRR